MQRQSTKNSRWFVVPKSNPEAVIRLFCFPYAGGNASTYTPWSDVLPASTELVIVQPPGRANRIEEQGYTSMQALVLALCDVVLPLLDKPYAVFGHSLGSRVGYEFVHEAKRRAWPLPEYFIASGSSAPHVCREHKKISHLADKEFIEGLKRFGGPTELLLNNNHLLSLFLPLLRADFSIADSYFRGIGQALSCPVSVFGGLKDDDARVDELPTWQSHFEKPIVIEIFEGDHFYIESQWQAVAEQVSKTLLKIIDRFEASKK